MENLLIVEDNLIQSHFMVNYICKELPNVRLYNIATTGQEAINIIKDKKVDIIVLDLNLPDMTGIDIINYIDKNDIKKYNSSIIIVTGEMELLSRVINNKYIYNYCSKINGIETIVNNIREISYLKQKDYEKNLISEQIKIELQKLNFDFSYKGTRYLCDCIEECYNKENIYNVNLKKEIYSVLSQKYNKTVSSIKTSIFKATTIMYYENDENDENELSDYFGYKIISKPKTRDIITTILQKIS